jgi:ribosome recycling factor
MASSSRTTSRQLGAIEKAIRDSDLGVNPNNDGTQLRIVLPAADRGAPQGVIKVARDKAEDGRSPSATSAARPRRARPLVKDGEAGEDDGRRAEKELDDVTHRYVRAGRRAAQAQGSRAARGLM